jgi:tetratricopeptide (TPR) repeat protein
VARSGALAQELYIVALASGVTMAKNNLAYLWARQNGLLDEALCLSAQTLEAEPDNAYYLDTYGFILLMKNEPARAEAYFRKAIRLIADYADALEHLGDVAAMTGKGNAADWWRRASSNPRDDRQKARIAAKLGGAPGMGDINDHPAFVLRNPGLPKECGVPSV